MATEARAPANWQTMRVKLNRVRVRVSHEPPEPESYGGVILTRAAYRDWPRACLRVRPGVMPGKLDDHSTSRLRVTGGMGTSGFGVRRLGVRRLGAAASRGRLKHRPRPSGRAPSPWQ